MPARGYSYRRTRRRQGATSTPTYVLTTYLAYPYPTETARVWLAHSLFITQLLHSPGRIYICGTMSRKGEIVKEGYLTKSPPVDKALAVSEMELLQACYCRLPQLHVRSLGEVCSLV